MGSDLRFFPESEQRDRETERAVPDKRHDSNNSIVATSGLE